MLDLKRNFLFCGLSAVLIFAACDEKSLPARRAETSPPVILWAWERPENLEFIDTNKYGVAFLAQTLLMKGGEINVSPRRQPLKVRGETYLIAVTRIESQNVTHEISRLSDAQLDKLTALIVKTAALENVRAVQIDYDAAVSERDFYRRLLTNLRAKLPETMPLSMTALASFCVGDRWIAGLPVAEAVPMIFRMGTDDRQVKDYLANGGDFNEPLCRKSYGIAVDEPIDFKPPDTRRRFIFNTHGWTQADLQTAEKIAGGQ